MEEKPINELLITYLKKNVRKNALIVIRKNGKEFCSFLNDDKTIYLIKELKEAIVSYASNGGISIPAGFRDIESTFPCIFIDVK